MGDVRVDKKNEARSNPEGDQDHVFCARLDRLTEINNVYGTHIQMFVYIPRAYRAHSAGYPKQEMTSPRITANSGACFTMWFY